MEVNGDFLNVFYILFCVQQKNYIYTGLKKLEGE